MKPKVLLIILPYLQLSNESKAGYWGNKYAKKSLPSTKMRSWPAFPYGALSVASYCKDVADIRIVDCNVDDEYHNTILLAMADKPEIVAFSMTFDNSYKHLKRILGIVRNADSNVITVIGGAATVPVYREMLDEQEELDAVCYYDGEIPFRKLIESADRRGYLAIDPSWITRYSLYNKVIPQKSLVQNLDDVIEIDYGFVNPDDYSMREEFSPFADEMETQRRFFVVTSKGCCFRCSFCYRSRENDRKIRYASVEKVIAHVRHLVDHYGMTVLTLCDDQLMFNMKRAKELFRQLEQFHLRVECMQGESVAFIDDEMAYLMKKAGMVRVVLAIESGSQEILDKMVDKPVNLDKAKEVIKILRKHGFWVTAVFVMGFPGETDAHRAETLKWIQEADLDWSTFSAAVPIKGTKLYDTCIEGGYIKSDIKLGDMDFSNYFIHTPGYDPDYVAQQIYKMNLRVNFVENYQMRIGDYKTASKAFRQVIGMYKDHAFAHYYLSACLEKMGDRNWMKHLNKFYTVIEHDSRWMDYAKEFGISGEGKLHSIVPLDRIRAMREIMSNIMVDGSIIEVGVWQGGTASYVAEIFRGRKIYLIDTFTGIPYETIEHDKGYHWPGVFSNTNVENVRSYFSMYPKVKVLQGIFPDAFKDELDGERFAVVHLDVDMYKSYMDGLEFLYPRTVKGGVIILDDYKIPSAPGATIAINEFLSDKPEHIREYFGEFYFIKE